MTNDPEGHAKKPVIISLGEVLWDILPEGKTAGGAPVNFTYHAIQNGADGYSVSALGNDKLGDELEATVRNAGIHCLFERNSYPTGTAGVAVEDNENSYTITENAAWDHLKITDDIRKAVDMADGIAYGTLASRNEESRSAIMELLESAPHDAFRFFDINLRGDYFSRDLIDQLLRTATYFKMNDSECAFLRSLFGIGGNDDDACQWFFSRYPGLEYVALTAGRRFSCITARTGERSYIRTPHIKMLNAIGSGDVFDGVMAAELLKGASMPEAHQKAVNTAAYVCTQREAWPAYPDEIPDYVSWQHLRQDT